MWKKIAVAAAVLTLVFPQDIPAASVPADNSQALADNSQALAVSSQALAVSRPSSSDFSPIPVAWKWIGKNEVVFTYDGTYTDSTAFAYNATRRKVRSGISAPEKFSDFPVNPPKAVNLTYSPDSSMLAFTRDNDLYVIDIATQEETRLTFDGSEHILNGYASWVYYEEIFGRPSRYRAFWWSPDSRKIGFYRFDNTEVPLFPIYSPFGQDGSLRETRYPKAGERNPEVRIGIIDLDALPASPSPSTPAIVWADFDPSEDQYFGTPFWSADSKDFYISRMPRVQNSLDLYAVSATDGSKRHIYNETYKTWIDWISDVIFTPGGLYMVRAFETGWQQIYFLSYDGSDFRRLTEGPNWRMSLLRVDTKKGDVYFTAQRDSRVRSVLYRLDKSGNITALTDTSLNVAGVKFSPDGRYFAASVSSSRTPSKVIVASSDGRSSNLVADAAPSGFDASAYPLPHLVWMTTSDGFELPAMITYPKDFDPSVKYPVHVDIYGGPDTPLVRDRWTAPSSNSFWWYDNGIIEVVADCRAAGHNGRAGTDMIFRNLVEWPVKDFIAWADWLKALPYVDGDRIGVEGFSFGGSMTTMLLFTASDSYHYGIAGGGVYDWMLYDTHYTERFMDTPLNNRDGYYDASPIHYASQYPVTSVPAGSPAPVMLKLTHGTGDDNVHFQNTLQLVDALQKQGKVFELMIYPDGMHGYRGYQAEHSRQTDRTFWTRYLLAH